MEKALDRKNAHQLNLMLPISGNKKDAVKATGEYEQAKANLMKDLQSAGLRKQK